MDSLKPCKIIGIVSVKENECTICEIITWNKEVGWKRNSSQWEKQFDFYSENYKRQKKT